MNKKEYMDILVDYLSDDVSDAEKYEILRDVEEMIEDGKLSGKSEEEIVSKLGSPKALVREIKGEDFEIIDNAIINKEHLEKKVNGIKENIFDFFNDVKEKVGNMKDGVILKSKKQKEKIDDYDTTNLKENIRRTRKKSSSILGNILKVMGSIFAFMVAVPFQMALMAFILGAIILIGCAIAVATIVGPVSTSIVFMCIFSIVILIGGILILIAMARWLHGLLKTLVECVKSIFV
ncbi:MAG: DUF1700 domain-containing protein [Sarcina sp.]